LWGIDPWDPLPCRMMRILSPALLSWCES
jgi:hypothetical protein